MMGAKGWLALLGGGALALSGAAFVPAGARSPAQAPRHHTGVISVAAPNQSNNWSGYNQGDIERNISAGFHSIAGDWIVPTASPHKPFESEFSSTWLGIGGGCRDASCSQTDGNTLIQTGTEQDVNADPINGTSEQYSAWYELIPNSSITIDSMPVKPGDHFHADIRENGTGSQNWTITLSNVTQNKTFSITTNYTSSYQTVEWIEEAPLVVGIFPPAAGFGPLPDLTPVHFDLATANGSSAGLKTAEQVQMVDFLGNVTATPSNPDATTDGFNDCTYSTTCAPPTTSLGTTKTASSHRWKRASRRR